MHTAPEPLAVPAERDRPTCNVRGNVRERRQRADTPRARRGHPNGIMAREERTQ